MNTNDMKEFMIDIKENYSWLEINDKKLNLFEMLMKQGTKFDDLVKTNEFVCVVKELPVEDKTLLDHFEYLLSISPYKSLLTYKLGTSFKLERKEKEEPPEDWYKSINMRQDIFDKDLILRCTFEPHSKKLSSRVKMVWVELMTDKYVKLTRELTTIDTEFTIWFIQRLHKKLQ